MRKIYFLLLILVQLLVLTACKEDSLQVLCENGFKNVEGQCVLQEPVEEYVPYDDSLFTSSNEIPKEFHREPSRFEVKKDLESGVNVVYQYDMPVPSFDTWDNIEENREQISLNGEWSFAFDNELVGFDNEYFLPETDIPNSFEVTVPSCFDFYNEDPNEWYSYQNNDFDKVEEYWSKMYGWYTRTFDVDEGFLNEKLVRLNSLGIAYRSWIFINGQFVEAHDGSYEYFSIDVGEYLREGENTISILVYRKPVYEENLNGDDDDIDSRVYGDNQFMPHSGIATWNYGGIHRDLWLEASNEVTVSKVLLYAHDGVLETYTILYNSTDEPRKVAIDIFTDVHDTNPKFSKTNVTVPANDIKVLVETIPIPEVKEWSYVSPNVYEMKIELYDNGSLVDSLHSTYGMRKIETFSNEPGIADGAGILLNGQEVKLKGFGWLSDFYSESLDSLGSTVSREMFEFQMDTIRNEMDANFLRNLQNDRHPAAYDVMDEYGVMNMQETPFHWLNPTVVSYQIETYGAMEMILGMSVWNTMNHPSIIMYSLFNEPTNPENNVMVNGTKVLNDLLKSLDVGDKLSTVCLRSNGQWWTDIHKHTDIYSFNQKNGNYGVTDEDKYGEIPHDELSARDMYQPLRYKLNQVMNRFPDHPILYSEPGMWQYNRTDTLPWQMKEYNAIKAQWEIIVNEPEFQSIGFSLFTYNEYKTTHLGSDGDGIAGFGVVPYNYSPEYLEMMIAYEGILPSIEVLGRYFDTLDYEDYAYQIDDE